MSEYDYEMWIYKCQKIIRQAQINRLRRERILLTLILNDIAIQKKKNEYKKKRFWVQPGGSQANGIASNSRKRRRSNKDDAIDSTSALNRIADALCRENLPTTLPEPPKIDSVGAFLMGLGNQIRQLPQPVQTDLLKQLTDVVYEAVKQNQ